MGHGYQVWPVLAPGSHVFRHRATGIRQMPGVGILANRQGQPDVGQPRQQRLVPLGLRQDPERADHPTQKPLGILRRIISVHSNPGEHVLDFFAGSGTTGNAALELSRSATLVDASPEAMNVMARRLSQFKPAFHGWEPALESRLDETS